MKKHKFSFLGLLIGIIVMNAGCTSSKKQADASEAFQLDNQMDSVSYGLGINIGENIKNQGLDSLNTEAFAKALADVYGDTGYMLEKNEINQYLNDYFRNLQKKQEASNKVEGRDFLAKNKKKEDVEVTESGLQYKVIKEGSGKSPTKKDSVRVHYHGTLIGGDVFDSSIDRGKPAVFQVKRVIEGWQEALTMMKEGAKWKVFIPYNLAYGEKGSGGQIGPYETLIFEIELLEVM